jgi:dTDP-4-dehydrorhamnose reductase
VTDLARPRILLLGAHGQVGFELTRTLAPLGDVQALDRAGLDLTDLDAVREVTRAARAQVIVNAAAYTRVEAAEAESEIAHRINGDAPAVLASEAARSSALLVHFSTDYVFDGAGTRPYVEDDIPAPRTAYGTSKLAGDQAVLDSDADAYVFRVAWVYSRRGQNFLNTIERLARERSELRVVADQHGSPTWSRAIAETTALAIEQWLTARRAGRAGPPPGLYHVAPPDHTTWHGFATEIVRKLDFREGTQRPPVVPITTSEYPSRVNRPAWTVLDSEKLFRTFGLRLPPWKVQLAECMA